VFTNLAIFNLNLRLQLLTRPRQDAHFFFEAGAAMDAVRRVVLGTDAKEVSR
jgi:hypothetical protein